MMMKDMWHFVTYCFRAARFAVSLIPNRPVVWIDVETNEPEPEEHWSRREQWRVLRPRFYGFRKRLPCGCSSRFGRVFLMAMDCPEHGLGPDWLDDD